MAQTVHGEKQVAPQPGQEAPQSSTGDALLVFIISLGKFFSSVFRISFLSYFFWTGMFYMTGATLMLVGIRSLAPQISGVCACPAKQNGYLFIAIWYSLGILHILTAYGYTAILSMTEAEFEHLTAYTKVLGFFVKVVPTYARLLHVFTFCQLDVLTLQVLLLPECNSASLVITFTVVVVLWWLVVLFGVWCKRRIFVPPFIYEPLRPSTSFAIEVQKLMRSFGP